MVLCFDLFLACGYIILLIKALLSLTVFHFYDLKEFESLIMYESINISKHAFGWRGSEPMLQVVEYSFPNYDHYHCHYYYYHRFHQLHGWTLM